MTPLPPPSLIPATRQRWWGAPAAANFALGGLGAGAYLVTVLAGRFAPSPGLALAAWLGPALVVAGLAAVATEAGRPLRGARVLARARSSWMSRELWLGGGFVGLAALDAVRPSPAARGAAAACALAFVVAQGFILRRARGVAAWDVGVMPAVFLVSALVSGQGVLLLAGAVTGGAGAGAPLGATLVLVTAAMLVWLAYVTWSEDPTFVAALAPLRDGVPGIVIVGGGLVTPFALAALALAFPASAPVPQGAAGACMIAGQLYAKWLLVTRTGHLRPITAPTAALPGRLS